MASITKRGNTYKITVSAGYGCDGGQKRFHMTWKPEHGMTLKQITKEVNRVAALFEEECIINREFDSQITFEAFSQRWMKEHAAKQLKASTTSGYKRILPRINESIGSIRLLELKPRHIIEFMSNIEEADIRTDKKYVSVVDIQNMISERKITLRQFARLAEISLATLYEVRIKSPVAEETMMKVCDVLGLVPKRAFVPKNDHSISKQTQLHHFRLISSILSTAVYWQLIPDNPCKRVKPPTVPHKEAKFLTDDEAKRLLKYIEKEDLPFKTLITLLLFTGMRRGEAYGLKWEDVEAEENCIRIRRALTYTAETGIVFDTPKTPSALRVIKVSKGVINLLLEYREWQNEHRKEIGDKWQDNDLVFCTWNGRPEQPNRATSRFREFIRHTDLPQISLHSLRHTNASLMIAGNTDMKTVAGRLGHARESTSFNIYGHAIASASEKAATTLEDILS